MTRSLSSRVPPRVASGVASAITKRPSQKHTAGLALWAATELPPKCEVVADMSSKMTDERSNLGELALRFAIHQQRSTTCRRHRPKSPLVPQAASSDLTRSGATSQSPDNEKGEAISAMAPLLLARALHKLQCHDPPGGVLAPRTRPPHSCIPSMRCCSMGLSAGGVRGECLRSSDAR